MGFKTNLFDMSSPWVGLNFLSGEDTVLVEKRQTALIKKSNEIHSHTVQMRHMYTQGGGIHCATLDTVREGSLDPTLTENGRKIEDNNVHRFMDSRGKATVKGFNR